MLSSKVLRMGIQKTPYQKTYELQAGSQEFTVEFKVCDRQFDWLEISLLFDKSDKHLTIYDSYNVECVARMIKNRVIEHIGHVQCNKYDKIQYLEGHSKNICYGNNMLRGIVTGIPPRQFPTTSTIQCFRSCCSSRTILTLNPMKISILICGTVSDTWARLRNQA